MDRQNVLWFALFLNLAAVGGGLGYVIAKPASIQALMEGPQQSSSVEVASRTNVPPGPKENKPTEEEKPGEEKPKPPAAKPADGGTTKPATAKPATEAPTKTAQPAAKPATPPAKKGGVPPKKTEGVDKNQIIDAIYRGPNTEPITTDPPVPETYPFKVSKRTFPNEQEIEIEFIMQNFSGHYWDTAVVTLQSTAYPQAVNFEIPKWGDGQFARLRYRFPKEQVTERVQNLRVKQVNGIRAESVFGNMIAEKRDKVAEEFGTKEAGGSDPATMSAAQAEKLDTKIKIIIPSDLRVPAEKDLGLSGSDEQDVARGYMAEARRAAVGFQEELEKISQFTSTVGFRQGMADGGNKHLESARGHLRDFDKVGLELARMTSKTKEPKVKALSTEIQALADSILKTSESVEAQVRAADPSFTIME